MNTKEDFLLRAYELGIIKFGSFTLKSGIESPFYVDLRPLASSPQLLKTLSNNLLQLVDDRSLELICGVPYAALPMATTMSLESGIPLIIKRKENKGYGTKRMLEGVFNQGQNCLLVEDVITSGKSLIETIEEVEKEGLKVTDIVVVLDREQGGKKLLAEKGYRVQTLFTINEVIDILHKYHRLSDEQVASIKEFLNNPPEAPVKKRVRYEDKEISHPVGKKLIDIALRKKSNLIASADVTTTEELLSLAEKIGDKIVALKLHTDIITNFTREFVEEIKKLAREKDFVIFEDRKFADIGNTQDLQFRQGIYRIADWADMVTAHVIAGEKSLEVFGTTGVASIVEMSSAGTLTDNYYISKALNVSQKSAQVFAVVAQRQVPNDLLLLTPGVNLSVKGDNKGQQYNTPEKVFRDYHTDFMIVGRGIYKATEPEKVAEEYRQQGWAAYKASLK
ncbi:orotidine-5'-phosphate decarboxylase [Ornithobacterium rhinotracheale]|uniref:orotidine-5'-phosphate decarboxylase n=1 Tax=Ornithobacterium rhinotracheale TaxID=28251 RepID=UPI001FF4DC3D|nr:orotidine-5'-phosphate decarboxylase [Ornithobacterium rhinotracheale]MCK0202705.1 orotidine-5'-phosphate decarboxylase [Ornithobacterium rhinotracheale]